MSSLKNGQSNDSDSISLDQERLSKMKSDLDSWKINILEIIEKLQDDISDRYLDETNLNHYQYVSSSLWEKYRNLPLSKAAFIHGITNDEINQHLPGVVDNDVFEILRGYESLSALNVNDPDLLQHLGQFLVPLLKDTRAILLFVYDNLNHLDPDGQIIEWTKLFPRQTTSFPKIKKKINYNTGILNEDNAPLVCRVLNQLCSLLGLWLERDTFDNISLLYGDEQRFFTLLDCVQDIIVHEKTIKKIIRMIKVEIAYENVGSIAWVWNNVASLNRRIPSNTTKDNWKSVLHRFGYFSIVASDELVCYRIIYALHRFFGCRYNQLRDKLWENSNTGYRAIHTILESPPDLRDEVEAIPIRVVPKDVIHRMNMSENRLLDGISSKNANLKNDRIIAFTPDGRPIDLFIGATPINFAAKLCSRFVAHLRGANINGRPASLFDPIADGDVVYLDISDEPRPLPEDWDKRIPKRKIGIIRRKFRIYFRPNIINTGRKYIMEQIIARGFNDKILYSELDDWAETTVKAMIEEGLLPSKKHEKLSNKEWGFLLVGIFVTITRGESYYKDSELEKTEIVGFIDRILGKIKSQTRFEIDFDSDLFSQDSILVYCELCYPTDDFEFVAKKDGDVITLHKKGAHCAKGGVNISRPYIDSQAQYFILETDNRLGIMSEILKIFKKFEIDLSEAMAQQRGYRRAVMRLKMKNIDNDRIDSVSNAIKSLGGVLKIFGPSGPYPMQLEEGFTSRDLHLKKIYHAAPYFAGPPIEDDHFFYGMEKEISQLYDLFDAISSRRKVQSQNVFIMGPKRVGKSSLVKYFIRHVERETFPRSFCFYIEALRGASWSEEKKRIKQKIIEEANVVAGAYGKKLPSFANKSLSNILDTIQDFLGTPIVFAIDEMVSLMEKSRGKGEAEELKRFCNKLISEPNRLLLWVGPEASLNAVSGTLKEIYERAIPLKVKSLGFKDTQSFLKAEKYPPHLKVQIDDGLCNYIFRLTGGHPYHIALLAKAMWEQKHNPNEIKVNYDKRALKKAVADIFSFGVPFLNVSQVERKCEIEILSILAHHQLSGKGLELTTIASEIKKYDELQILKSLNYLKEIGVVLSSIRNGYENWRIFSPLIKDFIKHNPKFLKKEKS